MRSKEILCKNEEFEFIVTNAEVGHLGIMDSEGFPRVVPLNFVCIGGRFYFHGALAGEKFQALKSGSKVTFCADIPYSRIPSYWMGEDCACHSSSYYKSLLIFGHGRIVGDLEEKAKALQALMEKYQPEGHYKSIVAGDASYMKMLEGTAVFRIDPERISLKARFGQQLPQEKRQGLIKKLQERNEGKDMETAEEMKKTPSRKL